MIDGQVDHFPVFFGVCGKQMDPRQIDGDDVFRFEIFFFVGVRKDAVAAGKISGPGCPDRFPLLSESGGQRKRRPDGVTVREVMRQDQYPIHFHQPARRLLDCQFLRHEITPSKYCRSDCNNPQNRPE